MSFQHEDFIDMCLDGDCWTNSKGAYVAGVPVGRGRKFYLGDEYCRHLREEYGHKYAQWEDRYEEA